MFLIMGISEGQKQLKFEQLAVCGRCGRYGQVTVWMTYTYFMLFFIPLFRWNKRYFARMSCCGASCELAPELGRAIAKGETTELNMDELDFGGGYGETGGRRCPSCGYVAQDGFLFCPKCGTQL